MGNPKQKWTEEEEKALIAGVAKYGKGNWKSIQRDPELSRFLFARSNIDLKDKWRNLSGGPGGHGSGERSRASKPKLVSGASTPPLSIVPVSGTALPKPLIDHSSKSFNTNRYNELIVEAISVLEEPDGSDNRAIISYIEQKQEVPQSFRKQLCSRLKRLVAVEKLEKVQNRYKIRKDGAFGVKTPIQKQKGTQLKNLHNDTFEMKKPIQKHKGAQLKQLQNDTFGMKIPLQKQKGKRVKQLQNTDHIDGHTVEAASLTAAYLIAEAEDKSFRAAEAVEEAERISKVSEDMDSMLQLVQEILETCSGGEIVLVA